MRMGLGLGSVWVLLVLVLVIRPIRNGILFNGAREPRLRIDYASMRYGMDGDAVAEGWMGVSDEV